MNVKEYIFTWIIKNWLSVFYRFENAPYYFKLAQELGYHILPKRYYSPVPDTRDIPELQWEKQTQLVGIDMNESVQAAYLKDIFPLYLTEFDEFPQSQPDDLYRYYHNNDFFVGADAIALYCLIRHYKPSKIIEVGSGFSSKLSVEALRRNNLGDISCIEPYPDKTLKTNPRISSLLAQKVQEVDLSFFTTLEENDILFIDTTHAIKTGGDVYYLFLEVLPRLKHGVLIHIHDIFLPWDYPRAWVLDHLMFSNEQYLVQAFMTFNSGFEILFSSSYMTIRYREEMEAALIKYPRWDHGCSLWIRRNRT
jgi:hypothetical protein